MPAETVTGYPFQGLKVLELTQALAGPATGKLFADYGAQSIVVDSMERPNKDNSASFRLTENKFGTNKLSLSLNLAQPEARAIVRKLAVMSDIVLHNFNKHTLNNWGLNYEDLVQIKPDIIVVTMPAMGDSGPYGGYRAWGWNLLSLVGFHYFSAVPGRPPICPCRLAFNDLSCNPFHTMVAILAALYYRARTGKGQMVELSQFESNVSVTGTTVFEYLVNGRMPEPMGNRLAYAAPHGVYRCLGADRWCAIAVFNDAEWQALCRTIGNEQMVRDESFATLSGRLHAADDLDRLIEAWTMQRTGEEAMRLLQEAGIAAGVVENVADMLLTDPQFKARNHWVRIEDGEGKEMVAEAWGFKFSAVPEQRWGRPPVLGEHNDYVLQKILQMSEDEINQLIVQGVID